MEALVLICICLTLITSFVWSFAIAGVIRSLEVVRWNARNLGFGRSDLRVSVIVPARNAAKELPHLINSLRKQRTMPEEVIVVDDESSDSTPETVSALVGGVNEFAVKYIRISSTPPGWSPKNWASFIGAQNALGNALVFLDSDVTMTSPESLDLLVKGLREGILISIMPSFRCLTRVCRSLETVLVTLTLGFTGFNEKSRPTWFFGCCWAVDKGTYVKLGTHSSVKECIVEEVCLSSKAAEMGIYVAVIDGRSNYVSTWHGGLIEGLTSIRRLAIGLGSRIASIVGGSSVAALYILPPSLLFTSIALGIYPLAITSLLALATELVANSLGVKLSGFSHGYSLLSPFFGFMVGIYVASSTPNSLLWRGRLLEVRPPRGR